MVRNPRTARKTSNPRTRPLAGLVQLEDRSVPATAFALSGTNLLRFDTDNPSAALAPVAVTGVAAGETLVGMDVRPQNGQLYALAADGTGGVRLYAVSGTTGLATPLTAAAQTFDDGVNPVPVTGTDFGFDFNPTVDRIRVVTDTGFNFRMDPNTGKLVDGDKVAPGVNPDAALSGGAKVADGAAYTNNAPNATATSLYALDATSDKLFQVTNPNGGVLNAGVGVTLGGKALDFTTVNGFDVGAGVAVAASNDPATGLAYAALTVGGSTGVYSIDLATGEAALLGTLGDGKTAAAGFAILADQGGTPLIGLSEDGLSLLRFSSATPGTVTTSAAITGVAAGETLVGIDYRPSTGQLLGLGIDAAADKGTLYVLDPQTAVATPVGAGLVTLADAGGKAADLPAGGYGFDVNPAADKLRVTTGTGLNFRIDPATGATVDTDAGAAGSQGDTTLSGGATAGSGAAYTNSVGGATATTLYVLDAATDKLFIQNPPNGGVLTNGVGVTVGGKAIDFTEVNGFDIPAWVSVAASNAAAAGTGYAALTVGGAANLYAVDLATGAATLAGAVGTGKTGLAGLAAGAAPTGTVQFAVDKVTVAEADGTAKVTLTRTGGSAGPLTVTLAVDPSGTATAGDDFTAPPTTVTFADGQTTLDVEIPLTDDALSEAAETISLTISAPTNGAVLGTPASALVTIVDDEALPTVSIADASAAEGNDGVTKMTFTVSLSAASGQDVTAQVDTADGTAAAGEDFTAVSKLILTIPAGQTSVTFTVDVATDSTVEADEAFVVILANPTGATLLDPIALGTITNDDAAANTPPVISLIPDVTTPAGTATAPLTFTVEDAETAADKLTLTAASSDPALVPVGNIVFSGTGNNRTVTVTPAAGQTGTATVTVTVTDASGATATESFVVTVTAAGTDNPPTIGDVSNQQVPAGGAVGPVAFTVGDTETPAGQLVITVASSNPSLVPVGNVGIGGSGANRTVVVVPAAGQTGTAVVTLTVTDADGNTASDAFTVTVGNPTPVGNPPTISDLPNQTVTVGTAIAPIPFTVADTETAAGSLTVTAVSSNPALVPNANLVFGGSGGSRTLTVTPAAGQTGTAVILVTVTDADGRSSTDLFTVTVNPAATGTPPTISAVADQTSTAGAAVAADFTVGDAETAAADLTVVATSSNPSLIPAGNVVVTGTGANRTVTVTPVAGQSGTAIITLVVTDANGLSSAEAFLVTVSSGANTNPTITGLTDTTITQAQGVATLTFTVGDAETAPGSLTVAATTSNPALLPAGNIIFGGSGANRTVTLTPVPGQSGTATVAVTVTDADGGTSTQTFTVTVPSGAGNRVLVGYPQFGVGGDRGNSTVTLYNPDQSVRYSLSPFGLDFTGGVRTAAADFNGDGVADLVVGTGPGRATRVIVLDGKTQAQLFAVDPFESTFTGGVYVAAGDLNGDGVPELVITPDEGGGPRVRVFDGAGVAAGTQTVVADFFGIDDPNFRGGARAAVADVNGDGVGDLVVAAGFGGGPRVAGYSGKSLGGGNTPTRVFNDFFVFEQTLRNGVFITAGDLDGDGFAEVIAGGGPGGGPRVLALNGRSLIQSNQQVTVANFFAGNPDNRGGIRVAVKDLDGDARADLVVGAGADAGSRVTGYLGKNMAPSGTPAAQFDFDAIPGYTGGVFVG